MVHSPVTVPRSDVGSLPAIIGAGAQTSVGLDLPMTASCVRCGMNRFALSEYLRDEETGEPMALALLKSLPEDVFAFERMKTLAVAAAQEALAPWRDIMSDYSSSDSAIPIVLSVPHERPGFPKGSGRKLFVEITRELPVRADGPRCGIFDTGHEGGLAALGYAVHLIQNESALACLVGGVESFKEIETLHWFEAMGRIKKENQPHGFLPGEGAGFILVCSPELAKRGQVRALAEVVAWGRAVEPHPWYSAEPTIGTGLTQALQQVFAGQSPEEVQAEITYCDLNGECWRADEWGYAYLRTGKYHSEPLDMVHPADCWGDIGAASGTLLVGLACHQFFRAHHVKSTALIWTASDTRPLRAACLLRKTPE